MINDRDLQSALFSWLDSDAPAIAATLTFRDAAGGRRLTRAQAQEAVRVYLRRLDKAAYRAGAKYRGMKVGAVPIVEGGEGLDDKRIHYHLWSEVPEHIPREDWLRTASREWAAIELAGIEQHFRVVLDARWLAYMLKLRDKPCYTDAVDLLNLRIAQRRPALKACSQADRMMTETSSRLASTAWSLHPALNGHRMAA
jgi:hypothetical protein